MASSNAKPENLFALAFPSERAGDEYRVTSLEDHIKYSLRAAILTQKGERRLNPGLGSEVRELLFRPLTPALRTELQTQIRQVIESSEPRIESSEIDIERDPEDPARMIVKVSYHIRKTRKKDSVRFGL